jgi:hypothetical protein
MISRSFESAGVRLVVLVGVIWVGRWESAVAAEGALWRVCAISKSSKKMLDVEFRNRSRVFYREFFGVSKGVQQLDLLA